MRAGLTAGVDTSVQDAYKQPELIIEGEICADALKNALPASCKKLQMMAELRCHGCLSSARGSNAKRNFGYRAIYDGHLW